MTLGSQCTDQNGDVDRPCVGVSVVRSAVERGEREGVFDVPDVNRALRAIMSLGIDLVRWYRLDGVDSPEVLGEFYAGLALRMIGSDSPSSDPGG